MEGGKKKEDEILKWMDVDREMWRGQRMAGNGGGSKACEMGGSSAPSSRGHEVRKAPA